MTLSKEPLYQPTMTMREARDRYFALNHFGADGGYSATWVDFQLGPIPFPFPNTDSRRRAVKVHDLHHILTDYDTNFLGEIEIAAWEVGAGCKDFIAAWVLNLSALGAFLLAPSRVFAAFVRGRRSHSFYGEDVDAVLERTVAEARTLMHVAPKDQTPKATLGDYARFAVGVGAGSILGLALMAILTPLAPFGYLAGKLARPKASSEQHA
ncbi:MAG: hypothetical protein JNK05_02185 [Myxococcales bacterium]|nr:hypothetical protein [Myxococcales bacterium]